MAAQGVAAAPALPASVSAALQAAKVPPEAVSMLVWPVEGAAPARLEHEALAVRQMASLMKLFTTGAALSTLGPAFVWRTDAALGGPLKPNGKLDGPLYLRGSGDPSLVIENVQLMMARWRSAGLKEIKGDVLIDRQAFDIPAHDPAAFDGKVLKPYNAGPDALLLNHQAISLRFMPDAAKPGQIRVSMEPELEDVRLDAHVSLQASGGCGDWREGMTVQMQAAAGWKQHGLRPWMLSVSGPYPASCGAKEWPVLWRGDGPGDYAARLLSATWKQLGGKLEGDITVGTAPPQASAWQSWASPPLGQIVRDINKFSNNVMARQLFLTLGGTQGGAPATLSKARASVTQQVVASTRDGGGPSPCEGDALMLDNGSGLSRSERSSARCLGRWLQSMWAAPTMPEFIASLPIAGTDGTARRLQSVAGRAHIKTGSLDGVAALAGYAQGASGRRYVVVAVINHAQADAARPALEALLGWAVRDRPDQN
jgi:D-alanyl-D-alanine carboxypeptidase/D-alanyl-D-alanine-endopeptidase (penicillin-binding protein 4)